MGVCLCKDKLEDESFENTHLYRNDDSDRVHRLEFRVDELVKETLEVIAKIIDEEPETPTSMLQLHDITDRPLGWLCLVKSLIRSVPMSHPMSLSVITLLLDDSPLPSKESVIEVADMINSDVTRTVSCERNFCVILGCLAEKLAGPSSVAILNDTTLAYLMENITNYTSKEVLLVSLIALEKFAQTAENKSAIKSKLCSYPKHPLVELETHSSDEDDLIMRQIGFCARWSLDNYFLIEDRKYSYETLNLEKTNCMLNANDTSEYLKISPDGLEARCDSYSFESVRSTLSINSGAWYFECLIITSGVMQIGWAQKSSHFLSNDGYGIGDDKYSVSFDGCRRLVWHNAKSSAIDLPVWQSGSICGCFIDLDNEEITFSLDGVEADVSVKGVFTDISSGFYPAASFMSFQQCRFNFGLEPFKFPPKRPFNNFNEVGELKPQDKIILPRHLFYEELRKTSVNDDSCTLCFDSIATIKLLPCEHTGFCKVCSALLQSCPICRSEIQSEVETEPAPLETVNWKLQTESSQSNPLELESLKS